MGDIVAENAGIDTDADYTGKIVIYETADTEYKSVQEIEIKYYKKENGVYVEKDNTNDLIDAIGITISSSLEDGWEDYIKDGLTIEYDTPSGRKAANMKLGGVYENGVNLLTVAKEVEQPIDEPEVEEDKTLETKNVETKQQVPSKKEETVEQDEVQKDEEIKTPEIPEMPEMPTQKPETPVKPEESTPTETPEISTEPEKVEIPVEE